MNPDREGADADLLRRAAWFALIAHAAAAAALATVLRPGLQTAPDLESRLNYLVAHRYLWIAAWATWNVSAVSILVFFFAFARRHAGFAVPVCAAAVACDLAGEAIQMGLLPELAARAIGGGARPSFAGAPAQLFLAFARTADLLSGAAANGLYVLATGLAVGGSRRIYPKWITWIGGAIVVAGVWLSVAAILHTVFGMIASNVLLMPALLAWLFGVARDKGNRGIDGTSGR
jgi:hypothetical protein